MKLSCKVIEDLLPIYHDGVCSEESRAVVEEHLGECESCRNMLAEMNAELAVEIPAADEMKPLKRIRRRSLIRGIVIAIAAITAVILLFIGATELRIFPVSTDKIKISELSRLENGIVAYHFYITDGAPLYELSTVKYENGSIVYITPKRALLDTIRYTNGMTAGNGRYYYISFLDCSWDDYMDPEKARQIRLDRNLHGFEYMFTEEVNEVYIGTPGDAVLLWKRGMELPAASEELEKKYADGGWR